MQNKHLLIFSYDYPPSNGGIARLCQEIATGMNDYYTSVTVLTVDKEGISKPYNYEQVKIVKLPAKRLLCELAAWWYLLRLPNKKHTDVLCGLWHPEGIMSLLAGIKNTFILAHGTEYLSGTSSFRKRFWHPVYCKWVLGKAKKVIANSHYTQQLTLGINPKARSIGLPLAVNHEYFKPIATEKDSQFLKLCTVSRVLQFKGHDFIARTIASLPDQIRNQIRWNIGGTGPYLEELKRLVKELAIEEIVTFHGFVPDEELPYFYNANDVFILCTREQEDSTQVEGFGLVFLEAQACGIPAIGTRTGGIPDAIKHGQGGWLIEQDNQEELSDLLCLLVENRDLVNQMSHIARNRVEREATWQLYCNNLNKLMQ
ncbi:glycosyltransferase family 4 protein [Sphingobacterium sp. T2]|uniref:glycosyltransferase family 4 protein n=1 Tax=Sphingobacterium sp. T2 TaxID=1590596 RepID=UPI00057BB01F|nr:glycosyltransferase family 4 protein [Sphingobacterium sp. T2]